MWSGKLGPILRINMHSLPFCIMLRTLVSSRFVHASNVCGWSRLGGRFQSTKVVGLLITFFKLLMSSNRMLHHSFVLEWCIVLIPYYNHMILLHCSTT